MTFLEYCKLPRRIRGWLTSNKTMMPITGKSKNICSLYRKDGIKSPQAMASLVLAIEEAQNMGIDTRGVNPYSPSLMFSQEEIEEQRIRIRKTLREFVK